MNMRIFVAAMLSALVPASIGAGCSEAGVAAGPDNAIEAPPSEPVSQASSKLTCSGIGSFSAIPDPPSHDTGPAKKRKFHTATPFFYNNHQYVLIAGGYDLAVSLNSPELGTLQITDIYDVTNNSWMAGPDMLAPRTSARAVLLDNGKVLMTGASRVLPSNSTEIFDPAASGGLPGAWSAGPYMTDGRTNHMLTRLLDGRVLAAGGTDGANNAQATAEIFSADGLTVQPTNPMTEPRSYGASVLLEGGAVLVTGGVINNMGTSSATGERFIPDPIAMNSTWSLVNGTMSSTRNAHIMLKRSSGNVLITGSLNGAQYTDTYYPNGNQIIAGDGTTSTTAVHGYGAQASSTEACELLVFGGGNDSVDAKVGNAGWTAGPAMAAGRTGHTATLLDNGKVLIFGGADTSYGELYTP